MVLFTCTPSVGHPANTVPSKPTGDTWFSGISLWKWNLIPIPVPQLCLAMVLILMSLSSFGQCPEVISGLSTDVTSASCPSSGEIVVHSDAESEPSMTYQIISGPAAGGYQTTAQSSNHFTGLPAGNYTITVTCGTTTADVSASVADDYTPINLAVAVTNVCASAGGGGGSSGGGGGDPGGRINAVANMGAIITASATGGKAPLQYAFLLSGNAAEPDVNFTYGSSNVFNAPSFGVYQVRVKDACNNFVTQSVDVQPIYPSAKLNFSYTGFTCSVVSVNATLLRLSNNNQIDPTNSGYAVDIWYISASDPCAVPTSAGPDQSFIVNSAADLNLQFPTTVQNVLVRTVSACGEESIECFPLSKPDLQSYANAHVGCTAADDVNLAFNIYSGVPPYNVTVQGYDVSGNPVSGTNQSFVFHYSSIYTFPTAHHYIYTVTDACGDNLTKTITTPVPSTGTQISWFDTDISCVNAVGTVNVVVQVNGFIPSQDLTQIKLVNATTNAFVANATDYSPSNGSIYFKQIPPGDYKIVFTPTDPACPSTEQPFTIPASAEGLVFSLNGSTTQLCGGAGTITADLDYNGEQSVSFELRQGATLIGSNATGSFTNLAPGTYTLKAIVDMSMCGKPNLEATKDLTIQPEGSDPVVVKKLGVNCEGSSPTGLAVFEFSGFGPFLLEMKKTTETSYSTIATAVPNNYTATGLSPDTDYDVRITDQCGKTSVTQVSVKPLIAVSVTNSAQPCENQPYTLSAEEITNADYSWTFNGGPVISTSKDVIFGSFSAANNGTYVCTTTLGDCVTKIITVNLNSMNCSQPLTKSGLGDYVWNDFNMNGLQDGNEAGMEGITVTLYAADGTTVLNTMSTNASGRYYFGDLTAGSYIVGFSNLPSGYLFTSMTGAINDANNSDANGAGKTEVITLADNEFNLNIDAGVYYKMPVTLINFTASTSDNGALLSWSTSTESNSDRFEIERSAEGKKWIKIGTVKSHGESNAVRTYSYTDLTPISGDNFYRLRMVDLDMSYAFSRIQHVNFETVKEMAIYPNPARETVYLKGFDQISVKEISLFNSKGLSVFKSVYPVKKEVDIRHLTPGLYSLRVTAKDGTLKTFKVVVAK